MKAVVVLCLLSVTLTKGIPRVAFPGADLIENSKPRVAFPGADLIKGGIRHLGQRQIQDARAGESRIVGGSNANIEDHPWQVSLRRSSSLTSHFCGASLVSNQWLITAAHCVDWISAGEITAMLGSTDRQSGTAHEISEIKLHKEYSSTAGGYPNDIALLRLKTPVSTSSTVQPIAMASGNNQYEGENCVITGWGRRSSTSGLPRNLQEVNMTVISESLCRSMWSTISGAVVYNTHVCVFEPQKSACSGDSGGPLVCGNELVGATSWGISTCSGDYPSVYTRISSFRNWIQTNAGI